MDFPAPEPRMEVSLGGRFFGLGIFGCAVIASIMIEKLGSAQSQGYLLPLLGGSLVLSILIPRLFFRRLTRY